MKNDDMGAAAETGMYVVGALAAVLLLLGIACEMFVASTAPGGVSGFILEGAILCMLGAAMLRIWTALRRRRPLFSRVREQDIMTLRHRELRRLQHCEAETERAR